MTELRDEKFRFFSDKLKGQKHSAVVIGCFALLHAGTTSFLSHIASRHQTISVVILPDAGNLDDDIADAGALLKRDERRRILQAMENIKGDVIVLDDTAQLNEILKSCGTNAKWFCNAAEGDVGNMAREMLSNAGIEPESVKPENPLSTRELLDRMRG